MAKIFVIFAIVAIAGTATATSNRWKRQADDTPKKEETFEQELCKDKDAGEWFRLVAGDGDNCRDVIQCTSSGLQAIRCPAGLFFDIEKQTCDWKDAVKNCKLKNKERKVKPLLHTDEPLCQDGFLACGDSNCIERGLFCNGEKDCSDGSDENTCDADNDPNRAPPCDPAVCVLPDCFCSEDGTTIPGDLPFRDVPQMITITFDDAINNNNIELYKEIFKDRKNPNGCDIKATYFVSHKYSNYSAIQETARKGHEIAVHSITHNDDENFWSNATVDDWAKEMAGMRIIIEKYANLTDNSVVGVRAPYLRVGGNNQFTMMEEQAFLYDSTITAALSNPPLWPYTMYFRMPHRCHGNLQNCPTRSHAVWEMVMNELDRREDPKNDEYLPGCAMVDSCSNIISGDQFYNFLNHNFDRHYEQNRAPLGLYFHAAWLKNNPEYLDAFTFWIDEILSNHNDVYFVTMTQVIQWIQNPKTISEVKNFEPWREKCSVEGKPACWVPNSCKLTSKEVPGETINLQTCVRCPNNYPWINDPTDARNDPNRAPPCDVKACVLPDCFCSKDGTAIPGNLPPQNVPQMITLTFGDAINIKNIDLYQKIFANRKNPNGCGIKGTFFVSHKYSNYSAIQELHRKGHEIAVHSITHSDDEYYWSDATVNDWAKEMAGMRTAIARFANITDDSVVGIRTPYLRVGGNNQFTMMEEEAFLYDSTITAPLSKSPLWPYTLYYQMPHPCHGHRQKCPTQSHAVWEMVINEFDRRDDPKNDPFLAGCSIIDACVITDADQFYNFLNNNFDRHYENNRAPISLSLHAAWLETRPALLKTFTSWVDEILENYDDVYFVTMTQVIQWIQDPKTSAEVKNFEPWKERCTDEGRPACRLPKNCMLKSKDVPGETINLQTCMRCPNNYPWLNDPTGSGVSRPAS